MKKIVLISCVKRKRDHRAKAKDLYTSTLFKLCYKYAQLLNPDAIYILSAKYHLLECAQEIEPYELTLNTMKKAQVQAWAEKVTGQLHKVADLQNDKFIFLAGEKYRKYLIPAMNNYEIPMQGLGLGKQLAWLKNETNKMNHCGQLHEIFNKSERYSFPFDKNRIPPNGIYILFEKGEAAHGGDRVVRIGTHTGTNQLCSRLQQHFLNENKDRSIFRKNIGRSLLSKRMDPFIDSWEIDLTPSENKRKYAGKINLEKQQQLEKEVSDIIRNRFSFAVLPMEDKGKRLTLESQLISPISLCKECGPSSKWFGLHSPKEKIKKSGLWQVNHFYKEPVDHQALDAIQKVIGKRAMTVKSSAFKEMITHNAELKITQFNQHGLHYNLVAKAAYRYRKSVSDPFGEDYQRYITAALISFDMNRMMGKGSYTKYDIEESGFASNFRDKLELIKPLIKHLSKTRLVDLDVEKEKETITSAYNELAISGNQSLNQKKVDFHVGATKILHFINPDLFIIIDSNAARAFRTCHNVKYRKSTQPGYTDVKYLECLALAKDDILSFGTRSFQALEDKTPLARIYDKLTFVTGSNL